MVRYNINGDLKMDNNSIKLESSNTIQKLKERIQYLENLDIIASTISKTFNTKQMIQNVIKDIYNIFQCDSAWLSQPINNTEYFKIQYSYTNKKYPTIINDEHILITKDLLNAYKAGFKSKNVMTFTINDNFYKNSSLIKQFQMKSHMFIILTPNNDLPWTLGIHQCSYIREWTKNEKKLFKAISNQLIEALNHLYTYEKLKHSEFKLKQVIDQAGDSIIIHNFNGQILDVNKRVCKNLGYTYDELIKLNIFDIEISITRSNIKQLWEKLKNKKYIKVDGLQKRKDGSTFIVEANMSYLNILDNQQIMIITRDIAERKAAEKEKLKLERSMYHTQKLESLGVLAGGIAHDFNNLLTIIQGNNQIALMKIDSESQIHNNLNKIADATNKATYLTKQMLAYSGQGSFIIETIYINKLITEMVHLLKSSISKKAILQTDLTKNIGTFNGDSTQIRQIIMNLIINASESLENKEGLIKISTKEIEYKISKNEYKIFHNPIVSLLSGSYIYIEVYDSGCGMTRKTQEKIFDPFYTTKKDGRGLGMSAILGIIKSHKGAINIYSELYQGTVIKIIFPKDELKPLLKHNYSIVTDTDWKSEGSILLTDDEHGVAEIAKNYLTSLGFNVIITYDGIEAVELYKKNYKKYKYVFLDLNMPKLDGIQTFHRMRKINPDIKAFIHSGYSEKHISKKYQHHGLAGFIQKPYSINYLIKLLKQAETIL
jgi:PAS domain S-box-containing protein